MTSRRKWSRRSALAGAGGLLLTAGCAVRPPARIESVLALGGTDGAPSPAEAATLLETAFDQAKRVTVPVAIDGRGPFAFVVDTGANSSVIAAEVALAVGAADAGFAPVHGINGVQPARLVQVERLKVGEVVSRRLRLPVLPEAELGAAGILGVDALVGRRVLLNFRDRTFTVGVSRDSPLMVPAANSRLPQARDAVVVPARFRSGQLVIFDCEAVGQPVVAFLDSGAQVTVANLALRQAVLKARPELAQRMIRTELLSATGQRAAAEFAPLPSLRVGGQLLTNLLIAFADLHIFDLWRLNDRPAVLIGIDVLGRFDQLGLDFRRREVSFWPPKGTRRPR